MGLERIMVDSSAWVALHHPGDKRHGYAQRLGDRLVGRYRFATTTHIVLESHRRLRTDRHLAPDAPAAFLTDCRRGRIGEILVPERYRPFEAILDGHRDAPPGMSLEDVSTAMTMRALGIRTIWAWDDDFRRMGFRVVP